MRNHLYSALSALMLAVILCMAPAVVATTIRVNDWVTLIACNDIDNAGAMTYAVSGSGKGDSLSATCHTLCIQDIVHIWSGESFLVQEISGTVGKFESPLPVGAHPPVRAIDYLTYLFESGEYDAEPYNEHSVKGYQDDLQRIFWRIQGSGPLFGKSIVSPWDIDLAHYSANTSLHHTWGKKVLYLVNGKGNSVLN